MSGHIILRCLPALALLSLALPTVATAQETFRWQFEEGEHYALFTELEMNSITSLEGQEFTTEMKFDMYIDWQIETVDSDGTATIVQTIDRIVMDAEVPFGGHMHVDTAAEDDLEGVAAETAEEFTPLIGQEFKLLMNSKGELIEFTLSEEALKALEEAGVDGDESPLSEESMRESLGQGLIAFPVEALAEGDQWNTHFGLADFPISVTVNVQYTYQGKEQHEGHQVSVFEISNTLKPEEEGDSEEGDSEEENPELEMKIIQQESEGHVWFDNEAGRIIESSLEQQFEFEMKVPEGEMNSKVETVTHLTLTPIEGE